MKLDIIINHQQNTIFNDDFIVEFGSTFLVEQVYLIMLNSIFIRKTVALFALGFSFLNSFAVNNYATSRLNINH